jgi:recombination protein RecA
MIQIENPSTPQEKDKAIAEAIKDIEKEHGKGSVISMKDRVGLTIPAIPTGIYDLDYSVLGVGGLPKGRIVEIFGPECVDANTYVQYSVWLNGKRINHKGGTIKNLYDRFHNVPQRIGRPRAEGDLHFFAPSINEDGRIISNEIQNVIKSGAKQCYEVVTRSGHRIVATSEHKFFTGSDYVELKNLGPGDALFIHNNTPYRGSTITERQDRKEVYVKHHPIAAPKLIEGKYLYYRLRYARAVVEAVINHLSVDEYIQRLNEGRLEGLVFLPRETHVHHDDEDHTNDAVYNLSLVSASAHGFLHAVERHNNLRFVAVEDTIESVTPVGLRETYDLTMGDPYNNYVADGFVVHNSSGKTTTALTTVASAQHAGERAAFIDVEHALDPNWATLLGCNVDDLLVSQPDYGEQALDICIRLVESAAFGVIVVDSVAALVPKAELDGEMGDSHMGLQARLMSQAMRKLTGTVSRTNTLLIFINQIREKIGVMFGSPETTTGGRALKFYSSVRLDVRRIGQVKEGDQIVGNKTKIKCVKNKVAAPFRECEVDLIYGQGFSAIGSLLDAAVEAKVVEKSGAWYSYAGERLGQGRSAAIAAVEDRGLFDKILKEVRAIAENA